MFDVHTLYFFGALSALVCAIIVFCARNLHRGACQTMVFASAAQVSMGGAMILASHHVASPWLASQTIANLLLLFASALIYESIVRIDSSGQSGRLTAPLLLASIVAIYLCHLWPDGSRHAAMLSAAAQAVFLLRSCVILTSGATEQTNPTSRWGQLFLLIYTTGKLTQFAVTGSAELATATQAIVTTPPLMAWFSALDALAPMLYALLMFGLVNSRSTAVYQKLADTDGLTGLHSRRSFFERAQRAMQQPRAGQDRAALLMFDLDKFKSINDLHGHAQGDQVLIAFSRILRENAPKHSLSGRFGGEEFCVMVFGESLQQAGAAAQRICDAVRNWRGAAGGGPARMSVSVGVAARDQQANSLEDLLISADRRLYLAKENGRDQVVIEDRANSNGMSTVDFSAALPI